AYLTKLSDLNCCDYVNGKGERGSQEIAGRMEQVIQCCQEFEKEIAGHCGKDGMWDTFFWELLSYHRNYILLFADALRLLAEGEEEQAGQKWEAMREYICLNEQKYQPFFDVYRILEVTRKYTGLYKPQK
ncbi:MAG: DUF4838 domain-containing protein, partial [Lachnospiraceae bacterium]|nr:DUF4838 domain-containing protein [Lachnospiraceae bacterium]